MTVEAGVGPVRTAPTSLVPGLDDSRAQGQRRVGYGGRPTYMTAPATNTATTPSSISHRHTC